ncbi:MAG TPA: PAS domain S-box protein [Polyangiaceae bacterium]|jgi:PAS domain S-box-containing protein
MTPEGGAWLHSLIDESPMAIGLSRDGVMVDANPAYARLFGYASVEELRGQSILEMIAASDRERVQQMVSQRARGESPPHRYQARGLRKDGTEFPFDVTTTRVVGPDGPLTIAFLSDVSERVDALRALQASEERFRTLASAALEGVFVHADGKVVLANEAGAAMFGHDTTSIVGVSLLDLASADSRAVVADHVRRGASEPYEGTALRRDGTTFVAEVRGRTLSHQSGPARVTIIRDVTETRRMEAEQRALAERVRQAQKLESLGILAGGVAHDFNNILTVIMNEVALARRERGDPAVWAAHLDGIAIAADRAAELCRQMLAYAGKAGLTREAVDLSALVAEMASMLEVSIARRATLVRELSSRLPALLGDATQLRQVAMNLVLNAAEAITRPHGTVVVSTGAGICDAADFARSAAGGDPETGTYVYLEVRDDGVGMDPQTVAHMFDPFFTTKFMGRGLGMAAVLGIVRGHDGAIDVESSPGNGTRIRVYFPATAVERAETPARAAADLKGHGVVLLVDDEKNVRISTQLLLEDYGFQVISARDGEEAIETFRTQSSRIGAVVLDFTMPRMDGVETLQGLRRIAPDVPVILVSGYGATLLEDRKGDARSHPVPDAILAKPYSAEQLVGTLQRLMR